MTIDRPALRAAARALSEQLEQLCDRLVHLGDWVRDEVARAVGGTAADAVHTLLDRLTNHPPDGSPAWGSHARTDDWSDPDPDPWAAYEADMPAPDRRPAWAGRWRLALLAGWQAAFGLWQSGRRLPAVLAAGAGLAAGLLAAPAGSPLAATAAAAASALALLATTDLARRVAAALLRWAPRYRL